MKHSLATSFTINRLPDESADTYSLWMRTRHTSINRIEQDDMPDWELAQLNIATLLAPIDSPTLAGFVNELDRINLLADQSPGFVWRLQSEAGNATELEHDFGDDIIANVSVWTSMEELHSYVYRSAHAQIMSRRKEWFKRMKDAYTVLWWVPQGHRPTLQEARIKLELLESAGPTADAFNFKNAYPSPSAI